MRWTEEHHAQNAGQRYEAVVFALHAAICICVQTWLAIAIVQCCNRHLPSLDNLDKDFLIEKADSQFGAVSRALLQHVRSGSWQHSDVLMQDAVLPYSLNGLCTLL